MALDFSAAAVRRWAFPASVGLVLTLLTAVSVSGSSIGILSAPPPVTTETVVTGDQDPDLLWGQPRPIRSDEWAVGTPLAVGQSRGGFPSQPWVGLTPTDLGAFSYSTPYWGWPTIAKPHTWGYLLLAEQRGLAWAWWFPLALAVIGVYWLLLLITDRPSLSAGLAILAGFTPYAAWWTSPTPALFIGFASMAAALFLIAVRSGRAWVRLLTGAASGYFLAALLIVLYPPWSLSAALVVSALIFGLLIDARPEWPGVLQALGGLLLAAGVLLFVWYAEVAEELALISGTVYPGQRVSQAGEGTLRELFSASTNLYAAVTDSQPVASNQSQASSSWVPLAVVALLGVLFVLFARPREPALPRWPVGRWTLVTQGAVLVLLLAWSQWPSFPQTLGELTLLTRIPGYRAPMAIGFSALLLVACMGQLRLTRVPRSAMAVIAILGIILSAGVAWWSATQLYVAMGAGWLLVVVAGGALMAATFAAVALDTFWRVLLPVAAAYGIVSFALVNPLYRGVGPLHDDPVARIAAEYAQDNPNSRAITLGGRELPALVRGGGMEVLSGTTPYPNVDFWESVAPGGESLWNNYRNYTWVYDPEARPIAGAVIAEDAAELRVNLCAPDILALGYGLVFSPVPLGAPCLQLDSAIKRPNGTTVYVYSLDEAVA